MEGLLAVLVGAAAVAAAPLVPGVRPVAKAVVKGGLAVVGVVAGSAVAVGQQLENLKSHVVPDKQAGVAPGVGEPAEAAAGAVVEAAAVAAPATAVAGADKAVESAVVELAVVEPASTESAEPAAALAKTTGEEVVAAPADEGLLQIDGIGPKVASLLAAAGITSLDELAATDQERLREILAPAGPRYRAMNPASWPEQARRLLESA